MDLQIQEVWRWLLVPYIDRSRDIRTITWEILNISGNQEDMVEKAAKAMLQSESVVVKLAPVSLLMELDQTYWANRDSISVKDLWNDLCCYCYLPRLMNYSVLEDAVKTGVNSAEFFALAAGKGTSGDKERYLDLKYNQSIGYLDPTTLIVKIDVARKQLLAEQNTKGGTGLGVTGGQGAVSVIGGGGSSGVTGGMGGGTASGGNGQAGVAGASGGTAEEPPRDTRFYLSAPLNTVRIGRDVQRIMDEVITHLTSLDGCKVEITLEVSAESANGFPPQTVRVVSENSRVLKIENFGFER